MSDTSIHKRMSQRPKSPGEISDSDNSDNDVKNILQPKDPEVPPQIKKSKKEKKEKKAKKHKKEKNKDEKKERKRDEKKIDKKKIKKEHFAKESEPHPKRVKPDDSRLHRPDRKTSPRTPPKIKPSLTLENLKQEKTPPPKYRIKRLERSPYTSRSERELSPCSDSLRRRDRSSRSSSAGRYSDYSYEPPYERYTFVDEVPMPVYTRIWPIGPIEHHGDRKITRKPHFVVPVRILLNTMKKIISDSTLKFDDEQRLNFEKKLREKLRIRIKTMLKNVKDYKGFKEILQMYRDKYPESSNEALVNEVIGLCKSDILSVKQEPTEEPFDDCATVILEGSAAIKNEDQDLGDGFDAGDPWSNGMHTDDAHIKQEPYVGNGFDAGEPWSYGIAANGGACKMEIQEQVLGYGSNAESLPNNAMVIDDIPIKAEWEPLQTENIALPNVVDDIVTLKAEPLQTQDVDVLPSVLVKAPLLKPEKVELKPDPEESHETIESYIHFLTQIHTLE